MSTYIALLRAINVGGTGKLSMARLRELCRSDGFERVKSYIQSGNLVLDSPLSQAQVKGRLESLLQAELGKHHAVFVRTIAELAEVLKANPFSEAEAGAVQVVFFDQLPDLKVELAPDGERLLPGRREVYVVYPGGMGRSRLKAPGLQAGTGRNLNTLRKLLELAVE
ncbi:MAG: DUF1697 domain-containing protein [Vulcanimicrobiota bacterium]